VKNLAVGTKMALKIGVLRMKSPALTIEVKVATIVDLL
jgi:hypothetical protein